MYEGVVPKLTSTTIYPNYLPGVVSASSERVPWQGVLVRTFHQPAQLEVLRAPGVPDLKIVMQLEGSIHLERQIEGSPWQQGGFHPGDLTVFPAQQLSAWRWDQPISALHMYLTPELLRQVALETAELDPVPIEFLDSFTLQDPLIQQIALALKTEADAGGIEGRLYAELLAHTLTMHLIHKHSASVPKLPHTRGKLTSQQLRQTLDYVHTYLDHDLTLAELARLTNISPYHFARLFKQSTGFAPHQYVLHYRIVEARRLLQYTDIPVATIAQRVGFSSQSHFTRTFRRATGQTPNTLRGGG